MERLQYCSMLRDLNFLSSSNFYSSSQCFPLLALYLYKELKGLYPMPNDFEGRYYDEYVHTLGIEAQTFSMPSISKHLVDKIYTICKGPFNLTHQKIWSKNRMIWVLHLASWLSCLNVVRSSTQFDDVFDKNLAFC